MCNFPIDGTPSVAYLAAFTGPVVRTPTRSSGTSVIVSVYCTQATVQTPQRGTRVTGDVIAGAR